MEKPRVFKLPLSQGVQTIILNEDSLDYDWKGSLNDFHGTLPYENLRIKMRVMRRDKTSGKGALIAVLLLSPLIFLVPYAWSRFFIVGGAVFLLNLAGFLVRQHVRSRTICVQIDPPPFGFRGELPIPDSRAGRAFLEKLEAAWQASLRRRFLVRDAVDPSLQLQRINWLELIGILTNDEAVAERSIVVSDRAPQLKQIASTLVN